MTDFAKELAECSDAVTNGIAMLINTQEKVPDRLRHAMLHATVKGGKRLRPLLVRQAAQVFGENPMRSRSVQIAVELVHCYSLVHDDLPAMDNGDTRRGHGT